jgi:hypothetical protein
VVLIDHTGIYNNNIISADHAKLVFQIWPETSATRIET